MKYFYNMGSNRTFMELKLLLLRGHVKGLTWF